MAISFLNRAVRLGGIHHDHADDEAPGCTCHPDYLELGVHAPGCLVAAAEMTTPANTPTVPTATAC